MKYLLVVITVVLSYCGVNLYSGINETVSFFLSLTKVDAVVKNSENLTTSSRGTDAFSRTKDERSIASIAHSQTGVVESRVAGLSRQARSSQRMHKSQRVPSGINSEIKVDKGEIEHNEDSKRAESGAVLSYRIEAWSNYQGYDKDGTVNVKGYEQIHIPSMVKLMSGDVAEDSSVLLYFENLNLTCKYIQNKNQAQDYNFYFIGCSDPYVKSAEVVNVHGPVYLGFDGQGLNVSVSVNLYSIPHQ